MNLENSEYLWLLPIIPCLIIYSLLSYREASRWLYRFARVRKKPLPFALSIIFCSLALGAVIFALAGPQVQYTREVFNRSGIDLAIGIDVSKSMLAEDETVPEEGKNLFAIPNRLNRARYFALNVISALRGERVGVFMFAGKGISVIPLTTDYGYCQYVLKHASESAITTPGSDLSQAVATGVSMLEGNSRQSVKTVILISDGEDISEDRSPLYEAARSAAGRGIAVYTVGTGMGQGVMIPIRDSLGDIEGYFLDEEGSYLKTRMEQENLKSISDITGGGFFRARDSLSEDHLVDAVLKRASSAEFTRTTEPAWFPLAPLLLCAAFLFVMIAIVMGR